MITLRYATHWLRFNIVNGLRPHARLLPASLGAKRRIRFHRYGFVALCPGKSLSVSWRHWAEGPCTFATYKFLRECAA